MSRRQRALSNNNMGTRLETSTTASDWTTGIVFGTLKESTLALKDSNTCQRLPTVNVCLVNSISPKNWTWTLNSMFYKSFLYFSCSDRVKEDDEVYCQNVAPSQEFQVELFTSLSLLSRSWWRLQVAGSGRGGKIFSDQKFEGTYFSSEFRAAKLLTKSGQAPSSYRSSSVLFIRCE